MKITGSLLALAASLLGPQAVSAAVTFSPPTFALYTGSAATLYKVSACSAVYKTGGYTTILVANSTTTTLVGTPGAIVNSYCGQQSADYFCSYMKQGTATSYTVGFTGFQKTFLMYSNFICDPSSSVIIGDSSTTGNGAGTFAAVTGQPTLGYNGCLGFTSITCSQDALKADSAATTTAGTYSNRRLRGAASQEAEAPAPVASLPTPAEAPAVPAPEPIVAVPYVPETPASDNEEEDEVVEQNVADIIVG